MSTVRTDLYTQPHKEQREWLFHIAITAGKIDYTNKNEVEALNTELQNIIADLHDHSQAEEAFIHPLYLEKAIELKDPLLIEHHNHEFSLEHLAETFKTLLTAKKSEQIERGLYFYRAFNRFITDYLKHQDAEERTLYLLWSAYSDAELQAVMMAYKASHGQQNAINAFLNLLPGLSLQACHRLFTGIKNYAQADVYNTLFLQAKQLLAPEFYQQLPLPLR